MTPKQRAKDAAILDYSETIGLTVEKIRQEYDSGDKMTTYVIDKKTARIFSAIEAATAEQDAQIKSLLAVMNRISKYRDVNDLRLNADKLYGVGPSEAIEMAYENVLIEARKAAAVHEEVTGG